MSVEIDKDEDFSEEEEWFQEFMKAMNEKLISPSISLLNQRRLMQMQQAYTMIKRGLQIYGGNASITCEQLEIEPDMGAIVVEGLDITVNDTEYFTKAVSLSDTMGVYPFRDGQVMLELTFNGLLTPIEWGDNT